MTDDTGEDVYQRELVELETSTVSLEINMKVSQKIGKRFTLRLSFTTEHIAK